MDGKTGNRRNPDFVASPLLSDSLFHGPKDPCLYLGEFLSCERVGRGNWGRRAGELGYRGLCGPLGVICRVGVWQLGLWPGVWEVGPLARP